jgi:hypothetical protein
VSFRDRPSSLICSIVGGWKLRAPGDSPGVSELWKKASVGRSLEKKQLRGGSSLTARGERTAETPGDPAGRNKTAKGHEPQERRRDRWFRRSREHSRHAGSGTSRLRKARCMTRGEVSIPRCSSDGEQLAMNCEKPQGPPWPVSTASSEHFPVEPRLLGPKPKRDRPEAGRPG